VAVILILIISLVPAFFINHWLQHLLSPRKSPGRLLAYLGISLVLVFVYTFLVIVVISNLFPPPKT
jgi:hypothetical protein